MGFFGWVTSITTLKNYPHRKQGFDMVWYVIFLKPFEDPPLSRNVATMLFGCFWYGLVFFWWRAMIRFPWFCCVSVLLAVFCLSTGIKRQERNSSLPKMSQKDAQVEKAKQLHDAIQKMTEEKIFERQLFGVGVVGLWFNSWLFVEWRSTVSLGCLWV